MTSGFAVNPYPSAFGHDLRGPVGQVKAVVDLLTGNQLDQREFESLISTLKKDIDSVNFTLKYHPLLV